MFLHVHLGLYTSLKASWTGGNRTKTEMDGVDVRVELDIELHGFDMFWLSLSSTFVLYVSV